MESIWSAETKLPEFQKLNGDIKTDVLIIGGGISGILTAYMLKQQGIDCIVAEGDKICSGTTKNTTAKCTENFRLIIQEFLKFEPHLVLLDISLPFYNGFYWCEEIRKLSTVPVVFISSASDNMNIIMAMNMGGDDFISKPFDFSVLTAKLQAILRRTYDFTIQLPELSHRNAVLNVSDASLTFNGQKIDLTKNDYRILQTLMEKKGSLVSRETLMQKLWETDCFIDDNTLTVNIARL